VVANNEYVPPPNTSNQNSSHQQNTFNLTCNDNFQIKDKIIALLLSEKELEILSMHQDSQQKSRHSLLLKVIIPAVLVALISYLLFYYYYKIFNFEWTGMGLRDFFGLKTLFCQSSTDTFLNIVEIITALSRFSAITSKKNSAATDPLRITNELLFLINKKQYDQEAFLHGAYYTYVWLTYDIYNLIKSMFKKLIYNQETISKSDKNQNNDIFEKLGITLCSTTLPIIETAATFFLTINIKNTPEAINARRYVQSIYSLARLLPIYIESNSNTVDTLLITHVLITCLEFFGNLESIAALFGFSRPPKVTQQEKKKTPQEYEKPQKPVDLLVNQQSIFQKQKSTSPIKRVNQQEKSPQFGNLEHAATKTHTRHPVGVIDSNQSEKTIYQELPQGGSVEGEYYFNTHAITNLEKEIAAISQNYPEIVTKNTCVPKATDHQTAKEFFLIDVIREAEAILQDIESHAT
jgi:hypothetical protein